MHVHRLVKEKQPLCEDARAKEDDYTCVHVYSTSLVYTETTYFLIFMFTEARNDREVKKHFYNQE